MGAPKYPKVVGGSPLPTLSLRISLMTRLAVGYELIAEIGGGGFST